MVHIVSIVTTPLTCPLYSLRIDNHLHTTSERQMSSDGTVVFPIVTNGCMTSPTFRLTLWFLKQFEFVGKDVADES